MKRQSFTQISETFVVCFVEYFDRNIFDTTGGIEDMARIYMIVCKTVWNIYTISGMKYMIFNKYYLSFQCLSHASDADF